MFGLIILCCVLSGAFSQELIKDSCPNSTVVVPDLGKVTGEWYEYMHSSNIERGNDRCFGALWAKHGDDRMSIKSKIFIPRLGLSSKMLTSFNYSNGLVQFIQHEPVLGKIILDSSILVIDYQNYAIVWSCQRNNPNKVPMFFVYTREPIPPCDLKIDKKIRSVFKKNGLQMPHMVKSDNEKCCRHLFDYDVCEVATNL